MRRLMRLPRRATWRCATKSAVDLLSWGVIGAILVSLPVLIVRQWQEPANVGMINWISSNLGYSVVAFGIVIGLFAVTLNRLVQALRQSEPQQAQVQQLDSLSDTLVSLSFGVGVIWTAIGMRNALVNGLTDVGALVSADGNAFAVLERLVDGGILVALSTTIFGGILGYLLRLIKNIVAGRSLHAYYSELDERPITRLLDEVAAIRQLINREGGRDADETKA